MLTTSFLSLLQVRKFRNWPSHLESQILFHQNSVAKNTEENNYVVMCNATMASFMMPKGGLCYAGQLAQAIPNLRFRLIKSAHQQDFITRTLHVYAIALRSKDPLSAL